MDMMEKTTLPRYRRQVSNIRSSYHSGASLTLGAIQISFAILLCAFAFGSIAAAAGYMKNEGSYSRQMEGELRSSAFGSLFVTLVCVTSGIMAICAAKKKTNCMIVAHMVIAIIATIMVFSMLSRTLGVLIRETAGEDHHGDRDGVIDGDRDMGRRRHDGGRDWEDGNSHDWDDDNYAYDVDGDYYDNFNATGYNGTDWMITSVCYFEEWDGDSLANAWIGLTSMVVIMSFIEFVALIWASSLTCRATCCAPHAAPVYPQADMVTVGGMQYPVVSEGSPEVTAEQKEKALEAGEVYRVTVSPPPPY